MATINFPITNPCNPSELLHEVEVSYHQQGKIAALSGRYRNVEGCFSKSWLFSPYFNLTSITVNEVSPVEGDEITVARIFKKIQMAINNPGNIQFDYKGDLRIKTA
jgi:hypothetical protein